MKEKYFKGTFLINNNYNKSDESNLINIFVVGYKPCGILDTMNNILCFPNKYNSNELKYDNLLMHSINIDNIKNYNKSDKNSLNTLFF